MPTANRRSAGVSLCPSKPRETRVLVPPPRLYSPDGIFDVSEKNSARSSPNRLFYLFRTYSVGYFTRVPYIRGTHHVLCTSEENNTTRPRVGLADVSFQTVLRAAVLFYYCTGVPFTTETVLHSEHAVHGRTKRIKSRPYKSIGIKRKKKTKTPRTGRKFVIRR